MVHSDGPFTTWIRSGDEVVAWVKGAPESANVRLIISAPDLLELARLFERAAEYEIRRKQTAGDDEGVRLTTLTLNMIRETIANATGKTV
jgi:hypothetical protein